MMRRTLLRLLAVAALLALPVTVSLAEEHALLTSDGTLHTITSGRAVDLGLENLAQSPEDNVLEWTAKQPDGTVVTGIITGTDSAAVKRGIATAFDEQTQTLILLWTEDNSGYTQIRVGVERQGVWTNSGLLPTQGISKAFNPQMVISHEPVFHLDEHDAQVWTTRSTLSIVWWEEAQYGQARIATLALDENQFDPASLSAYDLPGLLGTSGDVSYDGVPSGAYLYPALQADGLGGGLVVAFADLHDQLEKVLKVSYPEDQGKPSEPGNVKWQRRHIPIVGVASSGPIARMPPMLDMNASTELAVGTSVGSGYRPTMYWRDGGSLKYTHLDGSDWSPVLAIAIDDSMTYDKALSLVVGMGQRR